MLKKIPVLFLFGLLAVSGGAYAASAAASSTSGQAESQDMDPDLKREMEEKAKMYILRTPPPSTNSGEILNTAAVKKKIDPWKMAALLDMAYTTDQSRENAAYQQETDRQLYMYQPRQLSSALIIDQRVGLFENFKQIDENGEVRYIDYYIDEVKNSEVPEEALENFYRTLGKGNVPSAYQNLENPDRAMTPYNTYLKETMSLSVGQIEEMAKEASKPKPRLKKLKQNK